MSAAGRSAAPAAAEATRSSQSALKPTAPRAPAGTICRRKSRRACMVSLRSAKASRSIAPEQGYYDVFIEARDMAKPEQFNFSRRDFLKTAGVGSLATAVTAAGEADVEAQSAARVVGPGEVP